VVSAYAANIFAASCPVLEAVGGAEVKIVLGIVISHLEAITATDAPLVADAVAGTHAYLSTYASGVVILECRPVDGNGRIIAQYVSKHAGLAVYGSVVAYLAVQTTTHKQTQVVHAGDAHAIHLSTVVRVILCTYEGGSRGALTDGAAVSTRASSSQLVWLQSPLYSLLSEVVSPTATDQSTLNRNRAESH